jgi:branched-chain amino acid transport system ATP-binding protein
MAEPLLDVRLLSVSYGAIAAIRDCSIHINEGEVVAIVGANGAGKTTLLHGISNLLPWAGGDVIFNGRSTRGAKPHQLARDGITHVPEGRGVIGRLSVRDNLRIAYAMRPVSEPFGSALERVFARFPRMQERADQSAGRMSGGEQQMLALARALMNPPKLLLVDEPSMGLSPRLTNDVFAILRQFADEGMTILLVEQNSRRALRFAQRGYVLVQGAIAAEGRGDDMARQDVFQLYTGA